MIAVVATVAGILVAAAFDHRLGWGTLMSMALAIYCHRLYRQPPSPGAPPPAAAEEDELRPGWAARWGREPSAAQPPHRISTQKPSGNARVQVVGGAPVAAGPAPWHVTRRVPK